MYWEDEYILRCFIIWRHMIFDICDMYAKADMYGLGAGTGA